MTRRRPGRVIAWLAGLVLLCALAFEAYTRWPSAAVAAELQVPADTRYLVLVLHGSDGRDEPTLLRLTDEIAAEFANDPTVAVRHYIWSPWSDQRLRAGVHGQQIGRQLGEQLGKLSELRYIHLIGHSAGAYLMNPLCESYRAQRGAPAHVEMTYLDPMGIRGGWDFAYGYRHYGECADFALAVINSDDPVPGTNAPLAQAFNIDVTALPARGSTPGHLWPVVYFLNQLDSTDITPGTRSHGQLPRGRLDAR